MSCPYQVVGKATHYRNAGEVPKDGALKQLREIAGSMGVDGVIDTQGAVALKPLVLELVPDTAATHITVRAAPGKTFRVECSDTLAPGSWSTLSQFVLPSSPHTIADTERASYPKRFYRATEVP